MIRRILTAVAACLALATPVVVAAPAAADPVPLTIYGGLKMTPTIQYEGYCTLTAVGYDKWGNKVALVAGHCTPNGNDAAPVPAYDYNTKQQFGTMVAIDHRKDFDYAVIKVNDDVALSPVAPNGFRIDSVGGTGSGSCFYGQTSGVKCGTLAVVTPSLIGIWYAVKSGDSGAPLVRGAALIGMVDRINYLDMFRAGSPYIAININQILGAVNAGNGVGAGFTPAT